MNCSACIPSPNCAAVSPSSRVGAQGRAAGRAAPGSPTRNPIGTGIRTPAKLWRLMAGEVCERFRLMFFGNLHQDWSEFVLADLGVFQYERAFRRGLARIPVARRRGPLPGFACLPRGAGRDAAGDDGRAAGRLAGSGPGLRQRQSLAGAAPRQVLLRIGQACERAGDWPAAERVYAQCAYPGARHRRIRVHERMTLLPEALALAEQALAAPESEEEAQRVARMLPPAAGAGQPGRRPPGCAPRRVAIWCCPGRRTACRWNWPCATTGTATRRRRTMSRTRCSTRCSACCAGRRCSRRCRAHSSIRQRGPADLGAPIFRRAAPQFQACLALLDTPEYRDEIGRRYRDKQGLQSPSYPGTRCPNRCWRWRWIACRRLT